MGSPASPAAETAAYLARNAVECSPAGVLAERLSGARPLRVKLGLDPTAPDIHLGHTVVLSKLREFQDAGHTVVLIVGDFTARVGDPSGRSATRPVLSGAEIDANAETYMRQAGRVLRTDERLEVRRNGEWLDMSMERLFGLVRHPTVAQLLERDDFRRRWAADEPISLLELLYPVLQGYDSVAIEADVELGGTDQTFNLHMGRSVQQAYGQKPQTVLTMPLLTGIDGVQKMSKSLGNHIGVTEEPGEMYGKTMRIPDDQIAPWFSLLLGESPPAGAGPRDAKRALARALVTRFHSDAAAADAEAAFDRLFIAHELPGGDRGGRGARRERDGASARGDRGALRALALGRAPHARPGRRAARRRGRRGARRARGGARRPRPSGRQAAFPPPARNLSRGAGYPPRCRCYGAGALETRRPHGQGFRWVGARATIHCPLGSP